MKQPITTRYHCACLRPGAPESSPAAAVSATRAIPPSGRTPVATATPKPTGRQAAAHTSPRIHDDATAQRMVWLTVLASRPSSPTIAAMPTTVLIVDDHATFRSLARRVLEH